MEFQTMKVLLATTFAAIIACAAANADVVEEGAKGTGKGVKSVAGCADRGVKGTGKGVKVVAGCVDRGVKGTAKGAKTAVGGVGKAIKTIL
jgi:hypothetical protein